MGTPATIIRWLRSFLNDRRARVQHFNVFSSSKRFRQGLPQGSVLAPLLFLFYINDLVNKLSEEAVIAMFADDVSVLTTARNKVVAENLAQAEADMAFQWGQQWKIELNIEKSEVCAFSTLPNNSKWKPTNIIQGRDIPFNSTPRLLGLLLDRSLTFTAHADKLNAEITSKLRAMKPGDGKNQH